MDRIIETVPTKMLPYMIYDHKEGQALGIIRASTGAEAKRRMEELNPDNAHARVWLLVGGQQEEGI